jgi:uncharacterized protein YdiU (UPF0061 family)
MSSTVATPANVDAKSNPYAAQIPSINPTATHPSKPHVGLNELNFDNTVLKSLPIDPVKENYVRKSVPGACFSIVSPTPIENPRLVAYSQEALDLLDIDPKEVNTQHFVDAFSGNAVMKGSETAAHCYCGHQFGNFAGQLGDGRAMYLGEIVNSRNERWEMQLKGAGQTPYSRDADGRAVLRSSIREFLCSEGLYHLGIPTTRAGTLITSDSRVVRDLKYDGNPIKERVSVVLRIAPTFIRFGSFQIALGADPYTGRSGPSPGRTDIIKQLLDYTIKMHFSEIWKKFDNDQTRYAEFYREVVLRTARLVAEWQCVGFAHGVLNTDNMSILGVTIDFGPFGFLDYYDPDFICNGSDHEGRYAFKNQPKICEWNLKKLGEAMEPHLPAEEAAKILALYQPEQKRHYYEKMRLKLGLLDQEREEDVPLISALLQVFTDTSTDYTNVMRALSQVIINTDSPPDMDSEFPDLLAQDRRVLDYIMTQVETAKAFAKRRAPSVSLQQLQMLARLAQQNPAFLYMMGHSPERLQAEFQKYEEYEKLLAINDEEKAAKDRLAWKGWLVSYRKRIQMLPENLPAEKVLALNQRRVTTMNHNNPKFILRNWIAQKAIEKAEAGDYSEVNRVLELLKKPYDEASEMEPYVCKMPDWASEICVTCSS